MLPDYEILLGRGIGRIIFGLTKKAVTELLGPPDEIERMEDSDTDERESYGYNSINCSLMFDPLYQDRLVMITIENGYFHIARKIRVGTGREDLMKAGTALKFGDSSVEERMSELLPPHEIISFAKAGLHFRLDNRKISAIGISPLLDEKGRIIWPEQEEEVPE
jgi:hypothetical protein